METKRYQPPVEFIDLVQKSSFWVRWMGTSMGIWPVEHVSIRPQWYRKLYYFMLLALWYNTYVQIEFLFHNLKTLNLAVQSLCSLCSISSAIFKVMRLHAYENEIRDIWQTLENVTVLKELHFLRKSDSDTIFGRINKQLMRQWKEVHFNLRFYNLMVGLVACNYSIIPFCSNLYNQLKGREFNRSFVYRTYYRSMELLKYRSPLFEVLFCSESLSGYTTWASMVAFDGLYVVMVLNAVSLLRLLGDFMRETTNSGFTEREKIFFQRECIRYHIKVIRLVEKLNEIFAPVLLVQLLTSTSIICVIAFAASSQSNASDSQTMLMVLYLITAIYQLFQFCWYGQRFQNESFKLPQAVYDAEWEQCAKQFNTTHHILLLYSQRQLDMRAWNFSAMSLETFSTIIRSAVSYFTVLQTLAEE
ncbi:odorant receptor 63a-like [Anopheles nili]|uniref:odorant receptor 63a-like n=1 Tax=Anopheles nili TaxID=185578 RepID=UPI00237BCD81|nr:odorant receptor 63a-like [Anopheles nili]